MPLPYEIRREAYSKFLHAYGKAMMEWAALEEMLFQWFRICAQLDEPAARAVFFSARSFAGRRDMFAAIIPHSPLDEDMQKFLKACIKKAAQFSSFRNVVAHGAEKLHDDESDPEYVLADPSIPDPVPEDRKIITEQMETAAEHFNILMIYLSHLHPNFGVPASDAESYLQLVRALPNQADSTEPNRLFEER